MDTTCLDELLPQLLEAGVTYGGTFASDEIPDLPVIVQQYPTCMIWNTDPKTMPGKHWVAVYLPSPNSLEYWDPLGISYYAYPNFVKFIRYKSQTKHIFLNLNRVQSLKSFTCGLHCIRFLVARSRSYSYNTVLIHLLVIHH